MTPILFAVSPWVAEPFSKWGAQLHVENYRKFLWFELATVASQALKYYVITYTPYEGLNYTILNYFRNGNCPLG